MLWICKTFADLTNIQLYEILKLRIEVFVVEQNCPFQDCDDKDQLAYHLMGWEEEKLLAYSRLLAAGSAYEEMSIGRVVNSPLHRRSGIGKLLMSKSIETIHELFGSGPIKIGAQLYLIEFYSSFGFIQIGESYLEDGIPHIYMLLK